MRLSLHMFRRMDQHIHVPARLASKPLLRADEGKSSKACMPRLFSHGWIEPGWHAIPVHEARYVMVVCWLGHTVVLL